jgi:hypothetical protein
MTEISVPAASGAHLVPLGRVLAAHHHHGGVRLIIGVVLIAVVAMGVLLYVRHRSRHRRQTAAGRGATDRTDLGPARSSGTNPGPASAPSTNTGQARGPARPGGPPSAANSGVLYRIGRFSARHR